MADDKTSPESESSLAAAAKFIGTAAGKIANLVGASSDQEERATAPFYTARYVGSGCFIVRKPPRKRAKRRQSRLRAPQRNART